MKNSIIIIYTTFPNLRIAKRIVKDLVKMKLIACGNIFKIDSIYIWQGKIEETGEYGAFLKTNRDNYKMVESFIKKEHPYEIPEIISWNCNEGLKEYLKWVDKETNSFRLLHNTPTQR
uniref:Divalent-cation tolerance protein CutA n=1 Tax=candidate division WOR-3 bacterium TaxID=2052148 RepID=A0A7C4TD96_UNCW3